LPLLFGIDRIPHKAFTPASIFTVSNKHRGICFNAVLTTQHNLMEVNELKSATAHKCILQDGQKTKTNVDKEQGLHHLLDQKT
jgi:hypothetical protein